MNVKMPTGELVRGKTMLKHSRAASSQPGRYLADEVQRIGAVYRARFPELSAKARETRALRMALKLCGFELVGDWGDWRDLHVLARSHGLSEDEFEVVHTDEGEPILRLPEMSMRKLGADARYSLALH